ELRAGQRPRPEAALLPVPGRAHRRVHLGVSGAGAGCLAGAAGPGQRCMIHIKRAYEEAAPEDGRRFLVDRLWPRGIKKEALPLDGWLKEVAPSDELRRWFGHEPERWAEFQRRYAAELDAQPESWQPLLEAARQGDVTLVYAARDEEHNNAAALRSYLEKKLEKE